MENSTSPSKSATSLCQPYDNTTIARIIEEIRAELEFIKDTLHINSAGPCSQCGRKWFTSSQTGRVAACAVCNKTLCPTHMRPKCPNCKWRCCDEHWHVCDACRTSGGSCTNCLKTCQSCGNVYCYAANGCCTELGCDNCPKCFPVKNYTNTNEPYLSADYCSEHYSSEIKRVTGRDEQF